MVNTVRPVHGYVEQPLIRPRGGRATTTTSNRKAEAGDRLANLMSGGRGRGVENTDTLKTGDLMPVDRLEGLLLRMGALRARIDRALLQKAETTGKARTKGELVTALRRKLEEVKDAALDLWRDLPPEMGTPDLAVRFLAAMGGQPKMGG